MRSLLLIKRKAQLKSWCSVQVNVWNTPTKAELIFLEESFIESKPPQENKTVPGYENCCFDLFFYGSSKLTYSGLATIGSISDALKRKTKQLENRGQMIVGINIKIPSSSKVVSKKNSSSIVWMGHKLQKHSK